MRTIYCLLFILLKFSNCLNAQKKAPTFLLDIPDTEISLSSSASKEKETLPYKSVSFIDARPERYVCGFYTKDNGSSGKYIFKSVLENEFGKYVSGNFRLTSDTTELLIAVKKFWISDFLTDTLIFGKKSNERTIVMETEAYQKNLDYYTAFFRMDTVIKFTVNSPTLNGEDVCLNGLEILFDKCIIMSQTQISKQKRKFSLEDIQHHLDEKFSMHILNDTTFRKGIYYTFNDFKNNNPVPAEFIPCEEESGCAGSVSIVKENGEKEIVSDYWGLCDGQYVYIHYRRNILPVLRSDNALFISGETTKKSNALGQIGLFLLGSAAGMGISQTSTSLTEIRSITKSKDHLPTYPLLLDWDTGKFY